MPHTSPSTGSNPPRDRLAALGTVGLVVATVLLGALLPDRGRPVTRAAGEDPGCLEWTDGCRVCQRYPDGPACSLPGFACEPGAIRCLRPAGG